MADRYGFQLIREQNIPELRTNARLFRHAQTGAELLSLENDDENKVFGVSFNTPASNSTGLPHIMEHSVLCGSRKYPVKEPFVELYKGSLQTFLNAMTFPDKTMYPLASQNLQDFYNLIDVYLDAVFYPNITPNTLRQEGWHFELDDPDQPLALKGVVFNEMKGAYSDPDDLLQQYVKESLFPDNTYRFDSGGDPAVIPDLTYEQFKHFHDTYYHPSNAQFFFYGDDPAEDRLRIVNEYLKDYRRIDVDFSVALQAPFDAPHHVTYGYAVGQDDEADSKKAMLTVNWLLPESADTGTALALMILQQLLIDTSASPLRKALIDSGLGEDLAGSGLERDLRQMTFSTGLKGIAAEDAERVEALVLDTLQALVTDGIEPDMVEAAVNTVEFARRENNTGSMPRGIVLAWQALHAWAYGGDPFGPLAFEAPLNAIKTRLAAGERVFEDLIAAYFLDNSHRSTVLLTPDPELQARREAEERQRLDRARAAMTADDLQRVIEQTRTLRQMQETPDTPEALATIPSLALDDLDKTNKVIPIEVSTHAGTPLLYHDLFTNGIVYLDLGFDVRVLPQEYLPYVSLFGRALLEMGTETEDFVKLLQRIGRKTGGINSTAFGDTIKDTRDATVWFMLRGKATVEQTSELLAILRDVLLTARLDNRERFRQMVLEEKASEESGVVPAGHAVVKTRLYARFSEAGWVDEQMGGLSYLHFLRKLVDDIERDWPAVLNVLESVRQLLVNRRAMIANVTLDAANWTQVSPQIVEFLDALPAAEPPSPMWTPQLQSGNEGLVIPAQVNYVGKGADLFTLGYKAHGSIIPISHYLRTTWLWERVRVQGGAYGGFCSFDWRSGSFAFISYRDPNLLNTLDIYDQTADFLSQLTLDQDELVKSIIGAIGLMDSYLLPDAKGYVSMRRYLAGETDEGRQQMRNEILSTTAADFKAFAEVLRQLNANGAVVVLGGQEAIEKVEAQKPGWFRVSKAL